MTRAIVKWSFASGPVVFSPCRRDDPRRRRKERDATLLATGARARGRAELDADREIFRELGARSIEPSSGQRAWRRPRHDKLLALPHRRR